VSETQLVMPEDSELLRLLEAGMDLGSTFLPISPDQARIVRTTLLSSTDTSQVSESAVRP